MGFFVMIAQRTNGHVFPALANSANASMRLVSSFYLFCADFLFGRANQLHSLIDSNAARCFTITSTAMFARLTALVYNPHRQPSLLHPTL